MREHRPGSNDPTPTWHIGRVAARWHRREPLRTMVTTRAEAGVVRGAVALGCCVLSLACAPQRVDVAPTGSTSAHADPADLTVGLYNRVSHAQCSTAERRPTWASPSASDCSANAGADDHCVDHTDCTEGTNGRCYIVPARSGVCVCVYDECATDADCRESTACSCAKTDPGVGDEVNRCVRAECRTGDDCDTGYCFADLFTCRWGRELQVGSFVCATAGDLCRADETCDQEADEICGFDNDRWQCRGRGGAYCEGE